MDINHFVFTDTPTDHQRHNWWQSRSVDADQARVLSNKPHDVHRYHLKIDNQFTVPNYAAARCLSSWCTARCCASADARSGVLRWYEDVMWPVTSLHQLSADPRWVARPVQGQTAPATSPIIVTALARLRSSLGDIGSDHHHYHHYHHYQQPLYQGQHLLGSGVCHTIKQLPT